MNINETYVRVSQELNNFFDSVSMERIMKLPDSLLRKTLETARTMKLALDALFKQKQELAIQQAQLNTLSEELASLKKKEKDISGPALPANESNQLALIKKQYAKADQEFLSLQEAMKKLLSTINSYEESINSHIKQFDNFVTVEAMQQIDYAQKDFEKELLNELNKPEHQKEIDAANARLEGANLASLFVQATLKPGSIAKAHEMLSKNAPEEAQKTINASMRETAPKKAVVNNQLQVTMIYREATGRTISEAKQDLKFLDKFFEGNLDKMISLIDKMQEKNSNFVNMFQESVTLVEGYRNSLVANEKDLKAFEQTQKGLNALVNVLNAKYPEKDQNPQQDVGNKFIGFKK